MLSSISPLGERARNQRWSVTVGAYVAGSGAAGAVLGALLGLAGSLAAAVSGASTATALAALGTIGAAGLLADRRVLGLRVPSSSRQVDEDWLARYRGWVYGAGYGVQLGLGFTTIVAGSITYLAFACALLTGSVAGGAVIGGAFGLLRALPIFMTARVRDWGALRRRLARIERSFGAAQRVTATTHALAVTAAFGWAVAR
jgi:hypothetical protein